MKRALSIRSHSPRQKCIRTQAFGENGSEDQFVRKFVQVEADLVLIKNSVAQTAADLNLAGTLTRIPSGGNFFTTIELQGQRESFNDFLQRLDTVLSTFSVFPHPYKVIDVPLKERQKSTVKLVEAVPEKLSQGKSDGELSEVGSDTREVRGSDSKSFSSSGDEIEEKMGTLQLKRRPSIETTSNQSLPRTDELMGD